MGSTTNDRGYRYPTGGDAFGPRQAIENLAKDVDDDVQTLAGTIPAKSTLTTKGDTFVATSAGVVTRLPVPPDDDTYIGDASQATGYRSVPVGAPGNLLRRNITTATGQLGNTTGFSSTSNTAVLSSDATLAYQGARSLRAVAASAGAATVHFAVVGGSLSNPTGISQANGFIPVTPGEVMHAECRMKSDDATAVWVLRTYFYTSGGAIISNPQTGLINGAQDWSLQSLDVVVPANAAWMFVSMFRSSGASGAQTNFDAIGLWRGAGGTWRPTGVDIDDANTRVKPGDPTVVQMFNPATPGWFDLVGGTDARLSNARTPTAHAASHASGGADPVAPESIGAVDGSRNYVRAGSQAGAAISVNESTAVAIGRRALNAMANPNDAVAIGEHAMDTGTAIGQGAIAIGGNAARNSSPGASAVIVGYGAGENAPSGANEAVAIGAYTQAQASAADSTAVGSQSQLRASGTRSVAVGTASQNSTVLMQGGTSFTELPLSTSYQYYITGTSLRINGTLVAGGEFYGFGTGSESSITANAGTLQVIVYQFDSTSTPQGPATGRTPARNYHTVVGAQAATNQTGGIALGYNAYADVAGQVQIGTDVTVDGVTPPTALRVGTRLAALYAGVPTTGQVLTFDGTDWVPAAAGGAQGNLLPADIAQCAATTGTVLSTSSTVSVSTAQADQGTMSWLFTAGGTTPWIMYGGNTSTPNSSAIPVIGGQWYSLLWSVFAVGHTRSTRALIYAWDSAGTLVANGTVVGSNLASVDGVWQRRAATFQVPATANRLAIYLGGVSMTAGEVIHFDRLAVVQGYVGSESWALPTVPVWGRELRVSPTNSAIMQAFNVSTGAWQDLASGSGVVFGTTAGTATEGNDSRVVNAVQRTIVDAKGDLIVGTGADTVARLPVGTTNGHVLTVDSAEASGVKWAAVEQLLPRTAVITGATPTTATSGTVAVVYSATFGGAQHQITTQNGWAEFALLLDGGTYSVTFVHTRNTNLGIATLTLGGNALTTFDTYAATSSNNNFATVTGLTIAAGRHTLRVAADTKNASSSGFSLFFNAIQFVRTGA